MIALERIRRQGFTIKPVAEGLYIDPIDELTEVQRQWLIGNKPEIRQQLLLERWQWFLKLAMKHGVNPVVVAADFPSESDRLDVIEPLEHTDELLREWMATLCRDTRVRRRQRNYEAGTWVPVNPDGEVAL
jgi:hypothetical protein